MPAGITVLAQSRGGIGLAHYIHIGDSPLPSLFLAKAKKSKIIQGIFTIIEMKRTGQMLDGSFLIKLILKICNIDLKNIYM